MSDLRKVIAIGITGKAKVGKDTLAKLLSGALYEKYRLTTEILPLAGTLKDECSKTLGIPREDFDDPKYKEHLRPLMQWWGTEYRRNPVLGGYNEYWCDQVLMNARNGNADVIIVPDVRFDNEAELVYDNFGDGMVVLVNGVDFETTSYAAHASEKGVSDALISHVVQNDHSKGIEPLERLAEYLASEVSNLYTELWSDAVSL